ncbi:MAG TPA: asparagine synthase (glutamine-hydrolyzing) [Candidatus Paceibacterota bacterium]
MCGINGVTRRDRELVEHMNAATAHRGPDGVGIYENDHITFGHNRLAIIDLSEKGAQPMQNVDGSLVITYNGELYNYRELRRELGNYRFKSETDTEVILAAYEQWGINCLKRFNGIFAFGLWDAKKNELILARDPMGVKPLYYCTNNKTVFFSSEIKAFLETGVARTLDREAFSRYMRIADAIGPNTMFKEVKKLPPAHYAIVKEGGITLMRYWTLDETHKERRSDGEWEDRIRSTLDAAVTRQLVSDRPVGVFLSGGIDSSAVLFGVVRAEGVARTYTTRFEVGSEYEERFNYDAELAARTAAFFGTHHTEITLHNKDIIPLFEQSVWHLDEPSGSATALAQLALARETVRDVAVVLGGDGGDELFGGYERYRLSRVMDLYQRLPRALRERMMTNPKLAKLNIPQGIARLALFHFTKQPDIDRVLSPAFRTDSSMTALGERFFSDPSASFLDALMDADRELLTDGTLLRTDKLSMAAGLEVRVPLLDMEVVELAARIPAEQKVSMFATKTLFKNAMRDRLLAYLFKEPKRGWSAPAGMWLQQAEVYAYAKEVLSPSYYAPTAELFDWDGITAMLSEHYGRTASHRTMLWALLSFQLWARRFGAVV